MRNLRNILGAGRRAVALDLGADATRMLVTAPATHGGWRRTAACMLAPVDLAHDVPEHVLAAVTERVRELGLRGAACRITVAGGAFRMDTATLPALSDDELRASARFEALDRFGVDASSTVLQHVRLHGSGAGARGVLLLGAARAAMQRAAELVMQSGMAPVSVEHAVLSSLRAIGRWHGESQVGLVACLHVEPRQATLALLQDGCLSQMRCMRGDWNSIAAAPRAAAPDADAIALEPVDAVSPWRWSCLAEDTLRCLRQACGEQVWPARMVVTGPTATDEGLLEALRGVCGVMVEQAGSGRWIDGEPAVAGEGWVSALGAASLDMRHMADRRAA